MPDELVEEMMDLVPVAVTPNVTPSITPVDLPGNQSDEYDDDDAEYEYVYEADEIQSELVHMINNAIFDMQSGETSTAFIQGKLVRLVASIACVTNVNTKHMCFRSRWHA